ncbi:MAG: hypothetical protein LBK61_03835, partial [Spirochaetaceae bacterium]|nr:hypothetical protein [Spirochaetaceae bacterium]
HPPQAAASAASRGVLNPSFPHSLDHARASTVAISLRSSINPQIFCCHSAVKVNNKKLFVKVLCAPHPQAVKTWFTKYTEKLVARYLPHI